MQRNSKELMARMSKWSIWTKIKQKNKQNKYKKSIKGKSTIQEIEQRQKP